MQAEVGLINTAHLAGQHSQQAAAQASAILLLSHVLCYGQAAMLCAAQTPTRGASGNVLTVPGRSQKVINSEVVEVSGRDSNGFGCFESYLKGFGPV